VNASGTTASGGPHDDLRPKVLLVDDHLLVLEVVRSVLEPAFHIVGAVTDGQLAVDAALRLDPDVIVLDVAMPGIDGFQTASELKRRGSRARTVFLTMHDVEEYAVKAIEVGALGYVLKPRMLSDLPSALNHALDRRLFVPSIVTVTAAASRGREHAAYFHAHDDVHLDELSRAAAKALRRGDPVSVVAGEAIRSDVERRLTRLGMNVTSEKAQGRYEAFDTADALSQVMQNGRLDRERLAGFVEALEQRRLAVAPGPESRMTLFGDIAVPLWQTGQVEAAMSVEHEWDVLTAARRFLSVCMYPVDCFAEAGGAEFQRVCAVHSAVTRSPNIQLPA
jgi:DNA-binding NarL/FixJ family response regulator